MENPALFLSRLGRFGFMPMLLSFIGSIFLMVGIAAVVLSNRAARIAGQPAAA
jgi:hypothetical protein